jgi:putative membrane protein
MKSPKIDRQREHQANERTFLAWLRTSIALIGFGFAIARFGLFFQQLQAELMQQQVLVHPLFNSKNLGVTLVVFGILVIALAAWQYNRVFWQIERSDYRPSRWLVGMMTAVVIIIGLFSLPLLLWRNDQGRSPDLTPRSKPIR